jgi:flagella synthesis protein FlgN
VPDRAERARFIADLHAEASAFGDFLALLREEARALEARDIDGVVQIAAAKTQRVSALNAFAARRVGYLAAIGLPTDREGMGRWLETEAGPERATLAAAWRALLDTAREAQSLNRANGLLIEARLQTNQRLLAAMGSAPQPTLYGPDGQSHTGGPARTLGSA